MKKLVKRLIIVGSLAAVLTAVTLLARNEGIAEFMAGTVSRGILTAMGYATSWIPFSLSQIIIIALIIIGLALAAAFFVQLKKRGRKTWLKLLNLTAAVIAYIIFYNLSVGFAYHRKPLDLGISLNEPAEEYVAEATEYFIRDFAALADSLPRDTAGNVVSPYTFKELNQKLKEEYERIDNDYLGDFTPTAKPVGLSAVMAELSIAGFFLGPLGEANVTKLALDYERPFYIAHELAHAKGVMREFEADLTASYLLLSSDDPYLRYSGYMINYGYILSPMCALQNDYYTELCDLIPDSVYTEMHNAYLLVAKYDMLDELGRKINDLYLKLNGQSKGVGSYDDPGSSVEIPSDPEDPTSPPIIKYYYSVTELTIFSIYRTRTA